MLKSRIHATGMKLSDKLCVAQTNTVIRDWLTGTLCSILELQGWEFEYMVTLRCPCGIKNIKKSDAHEMKMYYGRRHKWSETVQQVNMSSSCPRTPPRWVPFHSSSPQSVFLPQRQVFNHIGNPSTNPCSEYRSPVVFSPSPSTLYTSSTDIRRRAETWMMENQWIFGIGVALAISHASHILFISYFVWKKRCTPHANVLFLHIWEDWTDNWEESFWLRWACKDTDVLVVSLLVPPPLEHSQPHANISSMPSSECHPAYPVDFDWLQHHRWTSHIPA